MDSGLRNGPRSLLTPQCGILIYACVIRSSAQTLCDDLARAEEGKDGKKRIKPTAFQLLVLRQNAAACEQQQPV